MRPLFLLFFVAASATFAVAQEPSSSPSAPVPPIATAPQNDPAIALDELIRRALQNNPQLPVARENLEAARQSAGAVRVLDNPVLLVVPGFSGSREARDEEIILSQPLDVFGQRRARRRVLEAEARRAEAEATLVERSLVASVKNAASDLFAAQEAETLGQTQVEVARLFRDAAERKAQLGDVAPVQVQRAELELLRAQNELEAARAERLVRRAALNFLIGQAPEAPLRVALAEVRTEKWESLTALRSSLPTSQFSLFSRPDIMGAQATLEARRAQVRVLERGRLPQIELQARRDAVTGSGGSTALRAVITVPVFDWGSNKRERRALEAEARAQEAQITLLRGQAATQVEQALIRLQQQRATVERYQTGIVPQTLDLLRKTQIGYAQGASTALEVLEAQRTLRQVQTEYLQALAGARTGEAALESALGATLPTSLTGTIGSPTGAQTPPDVAAPGTIPENTVPRVETPSLNSSSSDLPATHASSSSEGGR